MNLLHRITGQLFAPVDIASLVVFRIAFGLLNCWEMLRYLTEGYVTILWVTPTFHFKYFGFGWVTEMPEPLIFAAWIAGAIAAAGIALGLFYRVSAAVFCVVQSYFFLLDETKWMNHFYLICLLAFLIIFLPCHRAFSLDALRRPTSRSQAAPAWALWTLRAQMGIVYFYGGIAKIDTDWLLRAEPMRTWLQAKAGIPLAGAMLAGEPAAWVLSWGGFLFDLLIVPLLLWRKTRIPAFIAALLFHLANAVLFNIGVFPWLAIAMTTLFLDPAWPRRLTGSASGLGRLNPTPERRQRVTAGLLATYFVIQLAVPFRHLLYPGRSVWTEEGHRFAWHMMLRNKRSKCRFFVRHSESSEVIKVYPNEFLTDYQELKMSGRPDMVLQLAHHIGRGMEARGLREVRVFAKAKSALNARPEQFLIDPAIDLYQEKRTLRHYDWIVPLDDSDSRVIGR